MTVQRKMSSRGSIQSGDTLSVFDQHGEVLTTIPRASNGKISRFKAYGARQQPR